MTWNFGDLLDDCARARGANTPALMHGDQTVTWAQLSARSNNLARGMLERGAVPGDTVAIYLRNCTEYMETVVACFKARLVPVNVNYRYRDDELRYIFENSDAVFAVYGAEYRDRVDTLRSHLRAVQWLEVGSSYNALATTGDGSALVIERSGDDLLFIYTGGTTGMPKAVMWRQADLWQAMRSGVTAPCNRESPAHTPDQHLENLRNFAPVVNQLTACPLMHGTGLLTSIAMLVGGGSIVTLAAEGLDVVELWDTVQSRSINEMVIVGDAFAKPMLRALDENPSRWDISSLEKIVSSGVMWSPAVKQGLLAHNADMLLVDTFGSTEAMGFGTSVTSAAKVSKIARFSIGDSCKVFSEDFVEVQPGSGERGLIGRSGPIPLGYYKDEEKTARTFPTIDGVRYSIPGDWCTVDADGKLNLVGRGSGCINSGGEKIYPEEVEEVLKTHADIDDALVFGVADDKWGQAVTAVVSAGTDTPVEVEKLRQHVREQLADYKVPKRIFAVDTMFRAPNGKADYRAARAFVDNL